MVQYSNFDTIVFQTVLSVDVLCGEEIVTQYLIGQWKERRDTEGDTALGMNNLKEHYRPTDVPLYPSLEGGLTNVQL